MLPHLCVGMLDQPELYSKLKDFLGRRERRNCGTWAGDPPAALELPVVTGGALQIFK